MPPGIVRTGHSGRFLRFFEPKLSLGLGWVRPAFEKSCRRFFRADDACPVPDGCGTAGLHHAAAGRRQFLTEPFAKATGFPNQGNNPTAVLENETLYGVLFFCRTINDDFTPPRTPVVSGKHFPVPKLRFETNSLARDTKCHRASLVAQTQKE